MAQHGSRGGPAPCTSAAASTTSPGAAADLATGTVPHRPFVLLGQMTTTDPTRSPAGTESVWAYAHLPRGSALARGGRRRSPRRSRTRSSGTRPVSATSWSRAPCRARPTSRRADPSLDGGALNGGTAALHQQLVFRPTPGLGRPDTPFPGLFLAGSSAHPGGGVHGACGANAARAALLRARVGPRVYDDTVGAAQRYLS